MSKIHKHSSWNYAVRCRLVRWSRIRMDGVLRGRGTLLTESTFGAVIQILNPNRDDSKKHSATHTHEPSPVKCRTHCTPSQVPPDSRVKPVQSLLATWMGIYLHLVNIISPITTGAPGQLGMSRKYMAKVSSVRAKGKGNFNCP